MAGGAGRPRWSRGSVATPPDTLEAFLREEVGASNAHVNFAHGTNEDDDDEDDEYNDIDWCSAGEVPDVAEVEKALQEERARDLQRNTSPAVEGSECREDQQVSDAGTATQATSSRLEASSAGTKSSADSSRAEASSAGTKSAADAALEQEERRRLAERRRRAVARHRALALCYVARLRMLNEVCDDGFVQAVALSLMPPPTASASSSSSMPEQRTKAASAAASDLEAQLRQSMPLAFGHAARRPASAQPDRRRCALIHAMCRHGSVSAEERVMAFVARCRAMGIPSRLVMMLPLPPASGCAALLARAGSANGTSEKEAFLWAEVFDEGRQRWSSHFSSACDGAGQQGEASNVARAPWILAAGEGGRLYDATRRYCVRWTSVLAWRGSLARGWDAMIAEVEGMDDFGAEDIGQNPTAAGAAQAAASAAAVRADLADIADERELAKKALREPLPTSRAGFKRHLVYVLQSQLRQNEVVHPPGAKPVGLFQGKEQVWRRADVAELKTPSQWQRDGRVVRETERPVKTLRGGSAFAAKLFGLWQTDVQPVPSMSMQQSSARGFGSIPGVNNYGNIELFEGNSSARLPPGTVHVPDTLAERIAARMGVPFAAAVVGFKREGGQAKPRYGGVVIWERDEAAVLDGVAQERQRQEAIEAQERAERFKQAWRLLVKNILVDRYVEERHRRSAPQ